MQSFLVSGKSIITEKAIFKSKQLLSQQLFQVGEWDSKHFKNLNITFYILKVRLLQAKKLR